MSARPLDWSPLASSDPTPGDPDLARELGRRYRRTAEAIATAASNLRTISAGEVGWTGTAGPEIRKLAGEAAKEVDRAHDRYAGAGRALETYGGELEDAQRDADRALADAKDAEADASRAASRLSGVEDPEGAGKADADRHEAAQRTANGALGAARTALSRAVDARNRAVDKAAEALRKAADKQHDSLWDKVANVLDKIASAASIVATVCGVLALLVGWIPVIGQALAAILGTVALIASAIALVCHLALYIGGKAELSDVLWDVVSVATFGIGRLFAGAAKLSSLAARSKAWTAANSLVRSTQPALNSAARRHAVVGLVGLRRGASAAAAGRGPTGLLRGTGGLRGAYGGIRAEVTAAVRTAWRGRTRLPGFGGGTPLSELTRTFSSMRTQFAAAYARNGVKGVQDLIYGAREVGDEIARLKGVHATVKAQAGVKAAINQALAQDWIRRAGISTGTFADGRSAALDIQERFFSPDVTGTPAPAGSSK